MKDSKREPGVIADVWSGKDEDHDILTCSIGIDFKGGGHQGFGQLCLDENLLPFFIKDLCNTFGVSELKDLVGKKYFALRCFGFWNDAIEGLEAEDGKRFTITSWRKKHFCDVKDPLENRIQNIKSDIFSGLRRVKSSREELKTVKKDYTDWG